MFGSRAAACGRRGSVMVMMVVVSVVLTGLVLVIALEGGGQAQTAGADARLEQANQAAESGAQAAVWQFKHNSLWRQLSPPATLPTIAIGPNTFAYSLTCLDAGAVATLYWPFSEGSGATTADASGHGNTGQLVGGVSWTTAGKYGDALVFDGSSGYVDAGNNASTNLTGSVTMAAWVKMNSAGQDQKVGGNQSGISGGYKCAIYGLKAEFEVRDASNNPWLDRNVAGGTILTMGVWYHVAGVYNAQNNTIKTYVNGVLDRELDNVPANALGSTTGDFIMGREPWVTGGSIRYFDGTIDDVRVYNRALSDLEIRTLANTSVQIQATATLQTPGSLNRQSGTVSYICAAPTPMPPLAPALTVGGNLPMNLATISGNVQVSGAITGVNTSTVKGLVTYGTTYSDAHNYITITLNGRASAATKNAGVSVPTINYASIQAQAPWTGTSGTGQTYQFTPLYNGQVPIIYVNGNVTNPIIDTSQSGGTLLINGSLTITQAATYGSPGYPAYIICEKSMTHSGGALTITGGLYVGNRWTHTDCTINGDVCVGGNVTDNSTIGSSFVVGAIPWFDPRATAAPVALPLFYTDYQGVGP